MGALDFEESATRRAKPVEVHPGLSLRFCTAEDLIVMKAFAGRTQEWMDVRMTIVRQGKTRLDWDYIFTQLRPLAEAKEAPEILDQLSAQQARY